MLAIRLSLSSLLFFSTVNAASVHVYANCPYEVSCALVDGTPPGTAHPPRPDSPSFRPVGAGFHVDNLRENVGQGIHCVRSTDTSNEALLEWMYNTAEAVPTIWWDGSLVDGDPFHHEGFHVSTGRQQPPPGPSPFDRCWDIHCPAGGCADAQVYHLPEDDRNPSDNNPMRACPQDVSLIWSICLG
ncbi:hypothetical protein LTR70_007963 [Exophiala xenobiotica]|uniref:Uncharacterized protein n=1 Tax=Lithohypha guttulata TaxID=1690604 RepID=A0ABR0K1R4_9EURO|nr:hypothetical protein LTR24_007809 [Lithohypha guttulata]KAK5312797.1 hypothetical protein LTR70_007963 [Exophiala xenobiotica]